jgi:RNA polymerase sigma-B factor
VSVEKIRSTQYESFRLPLEDRIAIQQAMSRLLELEKRIIYLFFYRDFTQSQIAGVVGLSPKKVSRVLHRGLDRLRQILHLEG